jgi:hypothetical protein
VPGTKSVKLKETKLKFYEVENQDGELDSGATTTSLRAFITLAKSRASPGFNNDHSLSHTIFHE